MNKGSVYPLFSKVFYTKVIELDLEKTISTVDKICNKNWSESGHKKDYAYDIKKPSLTSKEKQLLKKPKLKFLKNKILEEFQYIKVPNTNLTEKLIKKFGFDWFFKDNFFKKINLYGNSNNFYNSTQYLKNLDRSFKLLFSNTVLLNKGSLLPVQDTTMSNSLNRFDTELKSIAPPL